MKVFVFLGFLACVSFANAGVVTMDSNFNSTAEEVRQFLEKYDPANITDVSLTLLNLITVTLKSASVSDFSKFVFPVLSDNGTRIDAVLQLPNVSANVDALLISLSSGVNAGVPSLNASAGGVSLNVVATYTSTPLRLSSLSALLQIESVSVKGKVELNGASILDLDIGNDVVDTINSLLQDLESAVGEVLLIVINKILSLIYPTS